MVLEIIAIGLLIVTAVLAFLLIRNSSLKANIDPTMLEFLKDLRSQTGTHQEQTRATLVEAERNIRDQLHKAQSMMGDIQEELGRVREFTNSVREVENLLKGSKQRGNLGEKMLLDLLEQIIPKSNLKTQYKFKSGETVDAIIKTKNGLIPIDSKFPVENYLKAIMEGIPAEEATTAMNQFYRDVKKHVVDIRKKYIVPAEGTVEFAIMYVPAEAIYLEILKEGTIIDNSVRESIFIVSPTSFCYFLQMIYQALQNERIEEKAKQVLQNLRTIQQDSRKFGEDLGVLERHLTNAKGTMDRVGSGFSKLDSKINSAAELSAQAQEVKPELDKPLAKK